MPNNCQYNIGYCWLDRLQTDKADLEVRQLDYVVLNYNY